MNLARYTLAKRTLTSCLTFLLIFSISGTVSAVTISDFPLLPDLTESEQEVYTSFKSACAALTPTETPIDPPIDLPPEEELLGRIGATQILAAKDLVAESNLRDACDALANPNLDEKTVTDAVRQILPTQTPAQGTSSVEISNRQFDNITSRMMALRSGATGISATGLTMQYRDLYLPGTMFSDYSSAASGGSAGSDATTLAEKLGIFVNGSVSFGDKDTSSSELGFDFDTQGLTAGVDYRLNSKSIIGSALGYVNNETDFVSNRGDMDVDGYTLSIYGTYYHDEHSYLDAIASVGWNDFSNRRTVNTGVTPIAEISGDTEGVEYALSIGGGYDFSQNGFSFGPFGRINYISADIDSYSEDTSTGFEFDYDSQDVQSLRTLLGGQLSYAFSTSSGVFTPQIRFEWGHEFKDDSRFITARFLNDATSTDFRLHTDDPDRNFFNLGAGLSATFAEGKSAFIYYESMLEHEDVTQESISAGLRLTF